MAYTGVDLINSTISNYVREGKFIDNVSSRVPFLNWLRKSGSFKPWTGNGKQIEEPAFKNLVTGNTQSLDPYDEVVIRPSENSALVPYTRKVIRHPIVISEEEMEQNSGREQMIDLVDSKMMIAELSFASDLETMLFGDGTGNSGKDLLGLEAFIPNTSNSGTFAGYDRSAAANAWIRCSTASGAKTTSAFDNLRAKMSNLTNTLSRGAMRPELYLTDQTVYEGYETLCYGKYMPTDKTGAIDLGFQGDLTFRGKPVVFGDSAIATASKMYLLNATAFKFRVMGLKKSEDSPFEIEGPFDRKPDQAAMAWLLSLKGALTLNFFRNVGALYSIT